MDVSCSDTTSLVAFVCSMRSLGPTTVVSIKQSDGVSWGPFLYLSNCAPFFGTSTYKYECEDTPAAETETTVARTIAV